MILRVTRTTIYALIAGALVVLGTPLVPSSLFIQQIDNAITGNQWTFVRTVTLPRTTGEFEWEIHLNNQYICADDGRRPYEQRGTEPLVFTLPESCGQLNAPGVYNMRHCISVIGPFSLRLRPTCQLIDFGEPVIERYESQQRALESKIEALENVIEEIAK